MELKALHTGWRRHLRHFRRLRERFAAGQDPKVFCLSCSDSRVSVHEIFDINEPGTIFEVKNVGGLFTDDAKAALVYALAHLKPELIILMHHTRCGGYEGVSNEAEPEIRRHLVDGGGLHAKVRVDGYLSQRGIKPDHAQLEQLLLEEGCRIQREAVVNFLMFRYPKLYREVRDGRVRILALLYHTVTGKVCHVPERLEGSEDMVRKEL
ncbi:MAG: carbonic anhydrase [Candidatus Altiarchaeota archaeon]